jgi:PLP dependent protein
MENNYAYLKENLDGIRSRIDEACTSCGRDPGSVTLIGVTKTYESDVINASIDLGITDIAENKVQEITRKYDDVKKGVKWHLIGHLQSNKVKYIIDKVDLIHSVDSLKLAEEISKRAKSIGRVMDILIQVNVVQEESKFGVDVEHVVPLVRELSNLSGIRVVGLMNIAPFYENPEEVRPIFSKMKQIFDGLKKMDYDNIEMKYLSMGMSNDFKVAIEEGANLIRVGTAIYGKRDYSK